MKKIFTLTAAVLASFSLWAVDYYKPTADEVITLVVQTAATLSTHAAIGNAAKTYSIQGSAKACGDPDDASKTKSFAKSLTLKTGNSGKTLVLNIAGCDSITLYHDKNSKARGIEGTATTSDNVQTNLVGPLSTNFTGFTLDPNKSYTLVFTAYEGTPGNGGDVNVAAVRLHKGETCEDPEFTVPKGGNGFVGDPINLAITSKNNSKPVNYAVTVDGVKGVADTDYSFNVSPGLVQATPLKAGTFVITFSQASDGTYCDAEDSATFVISAKTPVTSFEIDAPATAHVGEEVTIELKNFDAAPTSIVWYDGEFNEITAANGKTSYTFTPEATGKYGFQITAWNEFNELNEEAFNHTEIKVVVGTDASLSDLKVNGATLGDFATNKYEYAIGEFGVYEAINVTATAADAPYATVEVVDDKAGTITVTVTAEDKTTTQNYVMTYTRKAATELVAINESTTWDWTETGETADLQLSDATMPKKTEEFNFADLLKNPGENFKAASLEGIMEYVYRKQSDYKFCQGTQLRFVTTVAGKLEVVYSNTGTRSKETERRFLVVNGKSYGEGTMNATPVTTSNIAVVAGEVVISSIINDGKETASMLRFNKVVFTKDDSSTALDNTEAEVKAVKVVRDGQLLILKNGVLYNAQGAVVK